MAADWDLEGLWPGDSEPQEPLAPPQRWVWADMESGEHAERLRELAGWVDWLIATHEVHNQVVPCWYRHPAVVEHLTALYLGWTRAYGDDAGGVSEADWINTLHALIPHVHLPACATGTHAPPPPAPAVRPGGRADFEKYLIDLATPAAESARGER